MLYYKKSLARISKNILCNICGHELEITYGYKKNNILKCSNDECESKINRKNKWLAFYDEDLYKQKVEKLKNKINNNNPIRKEYWLIRGYSEEETKKKISNIQRERSKRSKPKKGILTKEYWLKKGYSEKETVYKISEIQKRNSRYCVEHWLNKGYSLEESTKKISEIQKIYGKKGGEKIRKKMITNPELFSNKIEYWLNKGYTLEESKKHLKERQTTFTLEKCIKKHGKIKGKKIYDNRQKEWVKKVFNKDTCIASGRSMICEKFIKNLINKINDNKVTDCFLHGKNEKFVYDNKFKRPNKFDLCYDKKIIEFNGDFWHSNPKLFEPDEIHRVKKITSKEVWEIDKRKIESATEHGYKVLVIWESEYCSEPFKSIEKCIKFLNDE